MGGRHPPARPSSGPVPAPGVRWSRYRRSAPFRLLSAAAETTQRPDRCRGGIPAATASSRTAQTGGNERAASQKSAAQPRSPGRTSGVSPPRQPRLPARCRAARVYQRARPAPPPPHSDRPPEAVSSRSRTYRRARWAGRRRRRSWRRTAPRARTAPCSRPPPGRCGIRSRPPAGSRASARLRQAWSAPRRSPAARSPLGRPGRRRPLPHCRAGLALHHLELRGDALPQIGDVADDSDGPVAFA